VEGGGEWRRKREIGEERRGGIEMRNRDEE
jgi:hypothetical protein